MRAPVVHTDFAEGRHSLPQRAIVGRFRLISEKRPPRDLREFEFRWNSRHASDGERTASAIKGAQGKRMMYRRPTT